MSSIIAGYEYDIFISYRHKDNKYDRWVSEFVDNLSMELESTFKENISIYFDQNAHDGLHDTDYVDESLAPKLKAVVFIPIVSQTYCDPNAFAWKNELVSFISLASAGNRSLKVKTGRGNVASRIIPVRIHDLDDEDQKLFEQATGSPFRPVDFVYRSKGVNRPLRAHEDEPKENQNHTYYRDQINKAATAVKEVIMAMRAQRPLEPVDAPLPPQTSFSVIPKRIKPLWFAVTAAAIFAVASAVYFMTGKSVKNVEASIVIPSMPLSIAVLPFADMSASHDQEYFGDGLSEELLNSLSKVKELMVISRTSAFSFKGKDEDVRSVGKKLNVSYVLEGSVRTSGDMMRITTQLINTADGSHLWSETYDRDMKNIFKVQDEIAAAVVSQLKIKLLKVNARVAKDSRPDVYNLWLEGKFNVNKGTREGIDIGYDLFRRAYEIDSLDARALSGLASVNYQRAQRTDSYQETLDYMKKAEVFALKAIKLDPNLIDAYKVAWSLKIMQVKFKESIALSNEALKIDTNNYDALSNLGSLQLIYGNFDKGLMITNRCIGLDPLRAGAYSSLSLTYMALGKYDVALPAMKKAVRLSPGSLNYTNLGINYLLLNDLDSALICASRTGDDFWQYYVEAMAYWKKGKKTEADARLKLMIDKYAEVGAFQIAEIYGCRGDDEKTIEWLYTALRQHDAGTSYTKSSAFFGGIIHDPRYNDILKRGNLVEDLSGKDL